MSKKFLMSLLLILSMSTAYAQTVAYVANNQSNDVSVIDTATNSVIASILVGNQPSGAVFSPDGTRVYVVNTGDDSISVIDTASNTVTAIIPMGGIAVSGPELVAITPDGKRLYKAGGYDPFGPSPLGGVAVISTETNSLITTIPLPGAAAVAITPDGSRAYVQTIFTDGVFVIDTATNSIIASVPVPSFFSVGIAVTPDGNHVLASGGFFAPNISVIDTKTNTIVGTILCDGGPQGLVLTPDGSRAYVPNELTNAVNVVDTHTNSVTATIPVSTDPVLAGVTPDGAFVYVSSFVDSTISVIDTSNNTVVATLPVGLVPEAVAVANLNAPFAKFTVENGDISEHQLRLEGDLRLGANSPGLDLDHQPLTLDVGNFSLLIPAGAVEKEGHHFAFEGVLRGLKVNLHIRAEHGRVGAFDYSIRVQGANVENRSQVPVVLKIGPNTGKTITDLR